MYEQRRYLTDAAHKISNWYGKPLAIIATMAFLFVCAVVVLISGFSLIGYLIVSGAIMIILLLMVPLLQYAHNQDIHALQARVDALAADLKATGQQHGDKGLSEDELHQVRDILKNNGDSEDAIRGSNRDRRPSLF